MNCSEQTGASLNRVYGMGEEVEQSILKGLKFVARLVGLLGPETVGELSPHANCDGQTVINACAVVK